MPSPFPGMDPFLESQAWEDFHAHFIEGLHAALVPQVRPHYVVRVELRVYLEHAIDAPHVSPEVIVPDVSVLDPARRGHHAKSGAATAVAASAPTAYVTLPMPRREHERYLTVRRRETMEVVSVIEVLSPSNKRPGSDGRREYLEKRETVLLSPAHLVELDLLRGGERLPTVQALPAAEYYAFVSRAQQRPDAAVYAWRLRDPLTAIPVPLAGHDPDATLDLQAIFTSVYDRAGYDYSLDYRAPVEPPLTETDAAWVRQCLEARSESSG